MAQKTEQNMNSIFNHIEHKERRGRISNSPATSVVKIFFIEKEKQNE